MTQDQTEKKDLKREPEHRGSIWMHPYMLYAILNGVILIIMILVGWLAWKNNWV